MNKQEKKYLESTFRTILIHNKKPNINEEDVKNSIVATVIMDVLKDGLP